MGRFGLLIGALLISKNLWGSANGDLSMYREEVPQSAVPLMPEGVALVSVGDFDLSTPLERPLYFSDEVQINDIDYTRLGMVHKPGLDCEGTYGELEAKMSITLYYTRPGADIRDPNNVIMHIIGAFGKDDGVDSYYILAPFVLGETFEEEAKSIVPQAFSELDNLFKGHDQALEFLFLELYDSINGIGTNHYFDDTDDTSINFLPHALEISVAALLLNERNAASAV